MPKNIISLVALLMSIIAISVSMRTATSDFQANQAVKRDTAELLATFRSLAYKGAVYSQLPKDKRDDPEGPMFVDISDEKSKIQKFLTSPTALAYYEYASKKSGQTQEENRSEEWRVFFLKMTELLQESNQYNAAVQAMGIEESFFNLSRGDKFEEIVAELADLSSVIENASNTREGDVILKAIVEQYKSLFDTSKSSFDTSKFQHFIRFLRGKKNVKDPNVDLFSGVFEGNETLVKSAVNSGADVRVTETMIIQKYKDYWKEFNSQQMQSIYIQPW